MRFPQVASLRGALGVVATCYNDDLCLRSTILDYFCVDVLKYDDVFGSGAPEVAGIIPDGRDIAFGTLVNDCRARKALS